MNPLVCPVCPSCGSRLQKLRFDPERHVGVVRCGKCDEDMFAVSLLANKNVETVVDPRAGELTDAFYDRLDELGRLPPVAKVEEVSPDVE